MVYQINCPTDKITKIKTALITLLFIIMSIIMFVQNMPEWGMGILILCLLIMLITYFNIPEKILVTDTDVILYNHGFKRIIKKSRYYKSEKVHSGGPERFMAKVRIGRDFRILRSFCVESPQNALYLCFSREELDIDRNQEKKIRYIASKFRYPFFHRSG